MVKNEGFARLDGKVAIVTGGSSGIGRATSILLAKLGAKVAIADVAFDQADEVARQISADGTEARAFRCDVRHENEIQLMISDVLAAFGRLDILVANAGVIPEATLETATADLWDDTMAVDGRGMFLSAKYAAAEMEKLGGGAIIFLSSISAFAGQPAQAIYGPAKFVASGLTTHLAIGLAGKGIRVNAVAPGTIDTPAVAAMDEEGIKKNISMHPLGRLGRPEEVAAGIAFLTSDEASFITGATLPIDGGYLAQ